MKQPSKKEVKDYLDSLPTVTFKNKYGEPFTIYDHTGSLTTSVLLGGSDVDMMIEDKYKTGGVVPLFGPFNIWSREELYGLGLALTELFSPETEEEEDDEDGEN